MSLARGEIVLTRLLYEAHEVELSLVLSLIRQRELREAYFWASELHASGLGERLWRTIWAAYYDFYAAIHPMLERELVRLHGSYIERAALLPVATAVLNLQAREAEPRVLELRLHTATEHAPERLNAIDLARPLPPSSPVELHALLYAVRANNLSLAALRLRQAPCAWTAYCALIELWSLDRGVAPPTPTPLNPHYADLLHGLLSIVVSMATPDSRIVRRCLLLSCDAGELAEFEASCLPIASADSQYLQRERRYHIDSDIGAFALPRHAVHPAPFTEHLWFHWQYYAARCPLWRARFSAAGATTSASPEQRLKFPSEEAEEDFAARWDVVPDEQSREVQAAASGPIGQIRYDRWLKDVFGRLPRFTVADLPAYA